MDLTFGPNTEKVSAFIEAVGKLTSAQVMSIYTDEMRLDGEYEWKDAWSVAYDLDPSGPEWPEGGYSLEAATDAAQDAYMSRVDEIFGSDGEVYIEEPQCSAVISAAVAIVVKELITPEQYDTLTAPIRSVGIL